MSKTIEERLEKLRRDQEAGFLFPNGPDINLLLAIIDADRKKLKAVEIFIHRMTGWGDKHRPHPGACDHCAFDRILQRDSSDED